MPDTVPKFAEPATVPPRSIAIVGNAPEMGDQASRIDAADWVVRFNNASGFGHAAGSRVTHLALVNHGGQMREWLDDPLFAERAHVKGAGSLLFPFPRKPAPVAANDADGRDWTEEATARLAGPQTSIETLSPQIHRAADDLLAAGAKRGAVPSTGLLVTLHFLFRFGSAVSIDVHGFGFAGWQMHDWARERRWFEAMAAEGMLRLHPLDARRAA